MERRELFFNLLGSELVKDGFEYKKSLNGFSKKENNNEYRYRFEIWPSFIQVEPKYYILIKEVEDIKKKFLGKEYQRWYSLGCMKGDFINKKNTETTHWTDAEATIRIAVQKEIDFYYSDLKPYFNKYSDIKFLDEHLNVEPYEHRVIAYNHADTYILAIIVAKLNNNPKLRQLLHFYKPLYMKHNLGEVKEYELLEKYIIQLDQV